LLGAGIPAYDRIVPPPRLRFAGSQTFECGIVNLSYDLERVPAASERGI